MHLYLIINVATLWIGQISSRGRNVTNSERLSYSKYQQKDFGYQENEAGLHMPSSKRSVTGNHPFIVKHKINS